MSYTAEQRRMIALARRLSTGYSRRVQQALLEAMAVEANFRNPSYGHSTSEGVLQQRPDQGWGPASETAATDIQQFLARAGRLDAGFRGTPGQLAQTIQRSAYPGRYDQRADEVLALLGGSIGSGGGSAAAPSPGASSGDRLGLVQDLLGAIRKRDTRAQIDALRTLRGVPAPGAGKGAAQAPVPGTGQPHGGAGDVEIEELIYDPLGSIFDGVRSSNPYGGHGEHVHVASDNPQVMLAIIRKALGMKLNVGENPYTTGQLVRSGHAPKSWHKREFKGLFDGRTLGMGGDISGDPRRMARLFRWVAANYG